MEQPGTLYTLDMEMQNDFGMVDGLMKNLIFNMFALQRDLTRKNAELEILIAEVKTQAITDMLTGLYNRRGFFEIGGREIERAKRYGHPLAVIMFDLDHYKQVNDAYGHVIGDKVLEETAAHCNKQLRKGDIIGRYGGDEFSILLPETQLPQALNAAERLRKISLKPSRAGQVRFTVSISLGVAVLKSSTGSLEELLNDADHALYKAKELGGNCICINEG